MLQTQLLSALVYLILPYTTTTSPLQLQSYSTSEILPPSQDAFYTAPKGFESTTPGTVLRARYAPGNITTIVSNASAVYNILYRTTDSNYEPSYAVTTLFAPLENLTSPSQSNQTSLLSIQLAYNSVWVDASPSYVIYNTSFAQSAYATLNFLKQVTDVRYTGSISHMPLVKDGT